MFKKIILLLLIFILSITIRGNLKINAMSSSPKKEIKHPAIIGGDIWTQKSKNNPKKLELSTATISLKNVNTGKIYVGSIGYNNDYTVAHYSVHVPTGVYIVNNLKIIQSSPHKVYRNAGDFDWKKAVKPDQIYHCDFYLY